jgi:serine/threonine protein kinase
MENFLKSLPDNFELYEFKLEKVLGQGGFGITYLALDMNLMQHVAIKEYYPREFANRDSTFTIHAVGNTEDKDTFTWGLKRFLDEARVLAQLSHPNVISIKRFFESHGTAYLVMEYCDGKPLDEITRDHGPLNESELNGILFPLLDGLEHVHGKAFLHRDIKPSNIFIRKNGSPVLLDFGAAKHEMTSHSRSVTSLATAGYAPFEQYSTKGKQGTWSDIYGLAATIYRVISGIKPQDAPDRMLEDTLLPATELLKGKFSNNLLRALDKALAIRPEARPQTIAEFRSLITEQPIRAVVMEPQKMESSAVQSGPGLEVDANLQHSEVESIIGKVKQIEEIRKEKQLGVKNLFIFFVVLALGGLWFFLPEFEKKDSIKVDASVLSEVKAPENVTPIVVEAAPTVPAITRVLKKSPLTESEPVEKKVVTPSKPALSFGEIDLAIESNQSTKAKMLLKEAILNYPDSAGAHFRLGQIFALEDKYPEAREQLNNAKRIDPSLRFTAPGKFQNLYNEVLAMEKMSKFPGRD